MTDITDCFFENTSYEIKIWKSIILNVSQVNMSERWDEWDVLDPSVSIDGVDCYRSEHQPLNRAYYSHKLNHAGLRYLIALSMGSGRKKIVWWGGGVPCGSNPDLTLAREIFVQLLEPRERALADLGFQDPRFFKTPIARPQTDWDTEFNRQHKAEMACHETINKRIKQFGILRDFRHAKDSKHKLAFGAIIQITQLCLEDQPLFKSHF